MAATPRSIKDITRFVRLCGSAGRCLVRTVPSGIHSKAKSSVEAGKHLCVLNNAHTRRLQLHTSSFHFNGTPALDSSAPLSPAVRFLVYTHNISDLSQLTPTGPGQRLLKGDVLKYMEDVKEGKVTHQPTDQPSKPVQPAKPARPAQAKKKSSTVTSTSSGQTFTDVPVDSERVAAAQRVTQHKATTPHSYTSANCSLDKVFKLGYRGLDLTAFFVKVAALTIQRIPQSNCIWVDSDVQPLSSISVSVFSDGKTIKVDVANTQSLARISSTLRDGNSTLDTSSASSISISHLSEGDVVHFTSVIEPTHSSTLSIGSPQAILNEQGSPSWEVTVTLTADARVMDYELSCLWLETFRSIVEAPDSSGLL